MNNPINFGKGVDVLLYIYKNKSKSMLDISWGTKITYSYLANVIHYFRDKKLISLKKVGRSNIINLTDKGKELSEIFIEMSKILNIKKK